MNVGEQGELWSECESEEHGGGDAGSWTRGRESEGWNDEGE